MTTTAQDALKAFTDGWLTIDFDGMTDVQQTDYIQQHYSLQIAAAKEIDANRIESEAAQNAEQAAQLQAKKDQLSALGYALDNSEADWDKLYNYPMIYGVNWKAQADAQRAKSTGVDYFVNYAYALLNAPYMVDTHYYVGQTFVYEGFLYEVIQEHTSQADWIPSSTPALYKKAQTEEWPQWVQPTGAHDAYNIGDKVTYNGLHYQSLINGNTWSPDAYPAGWQQM